MKILNLLMMSGLILAADAGFAATKTAVVKKIAPAKNSSYEEYRSAPNEGPLFATSPSPYANMLDQNNLDVKGAKIIRATKPSFGIGYGLLTLNAQEKFDDNKSKGKTDSSGLQAFAVFPTPIGLRLGVNYLQVDSKLKASLVSSVTSTLKEYSQSIAITATGAFRNGFGAGITLSTNKEEEKFSVEGISTSYERDVNYGLLEPQIYYSNEELEAILTWTPSLRHETSTKHGTYELTVEYGTGDIHPYLDLTRYRNSENDGEELNDHFAVKGGVRYILDRESNLLVLLLANEAFYTERQYASPGRVATYGLMLNGEHVINAQHVLGYGLIYKQLSGKGQAGSRSSKISGDFTGFVASYKYVMR